MRRPPHILKCFREMPGVGNLGDSEIYRDMGSGFGIFGLVFAVRVGLDLVSNGLSIKAGPKTARCLCFMSTTMLS